MVMNNFNLTETEIEEIWDDTENAAINAWGPLGAPNCRSNPHPSGSHKADIWDHAFRHFYAKENGY